MNPYREPSKPKSRRLREYFVDHKRWLRITPLTAVLAAVLLAGVSLAATAALHVNGLQTDAQATVPGTPTAASPILWSDTTSSPQLRFSDGTNDTYIQKSKAVALVDGATINTDASLGNVFTVTLGGNRTLANPTNLVAGYSYMWVITQDATGSRTLTYGTTFAWPGGTAPTLTTTAAAVDIITAIYDGTKLRSVSTLNLK